MVPFFDSSVINAYNDYILKARQWVFEVEDKFKEDVILDLKSKNLIVKEVLGRIVAKEMDLYANTGRTISTLEDG